MAQGMIYMVDKDGELTAMSPAEPKSEDWMQHLVARHPELITDGDGDLLLIRREQPIADGADGGGRWSLDHLFVTRTGIPVLVELKRASDTRLRREVVGQMLDYAANGTAHWQAGRIAEAFARTATEAGRDPDAMLLEFVGDDGLDGFWEQVDANFTAGRIKLVFVADTIPRELARVVEFLNDQMRADVRAVELRWFESLEKGITTLSPRVIGETERTIAAKAGAQGRSPLTRDEWVKQHFTPLGDDGMAAAEAFLAMVEGEGAQADLSDAQGSIYAAFPTSDGRIIYPMSLLYYSRGQVSLNLGYLQHRPPYDSGDVRQTLYDRLADIVGPLSTRTMTGFPAFPLVRLLDPQVREKVRLLLTEIVENVRSGGPHQPVVT